MEYYKDVTHAKKDRRIIGRKGPRDLQRQQAVSPQPVISNVDSEAIVAELRKQVSTLLEELAKRPVAAEATGSAIPAGMFTAEEFDKELVRQVSSVIKDTEAKYKRQIEELKNKISNTPDISKYEQEINKLKKDLNVIEKDYLRLESEIETLNTKLESKDAIIASKDETIESLKLRGVSESIEFIEDPDRPSMETVFIDPNERGEGEAMESHIIVEEKKDVQIGDQVNKLKGLLGGLPK